MQTARLPHTPATRAHEGSPGRECERTATQILRPGSQAGDAFQVIAHACIERFRLNEARLARTGDPETLHQVRVALRQLRSALSVFAPIVADDRFDCLRGELRWLAASLNEARDLDVLVASLGEPPVALLVARNRAYAQASKTLASVRARQLMPELADWVDRGVWHEVRNPADVTAAAFATESLDRLLRRLKRKGRHLRGQDDAELHELRIAAKKLRYASEFFAPLFPHTEAQEHPEPFTLAVRKLQDGLGEVQDRAVAPALLEQLEIPRTRWPKPIGRKRLLKRADTQFDRVTDARPFWR